MATPIQGYNPVSTLPDEILRAKSGGKQAVSKFVTSVPVSSIESYESSAPDEDEDDDPEPIIKDLHQVETPTNDTIYKDEECECVTDEVSSCHNIADQSFDMANHIQQSIRYQDRHKTLRREILSEDIACKKLIPFHNEHGYDPFQYEKVLLKLNDKKIQIKRVYCEAPGHESYRGQPNLQDLGHFEDTKDEFHLSSIKGFIYGG